MTSLQYTVHFDLTSIHTFDLWECLNLVAFNCCVRLIEESIRVFRQALLWMLFKNTCLYIDTNTLTVCTKYWDTFQSKQVSGYSSTSVQNMYFYVTALFCFTVHSLFTKLFKTLYILNDISTYMIIYCNFPSQTYLSPKIPELSFY